MSITTNLATRYRLKTIIMAVVCLGLGLWGAWDYLVAIPRAATESGIANTMRIVKNGLDAPLGSEQRDEAILVLRVAIERNNSPNDNWGDSLQTLVTAVEGGDRQLHLESMLIIDDFLNKYGSVVAPSKYDRPVQWLFILCLPFGFYYLWRYSKMSRKAKAYSLDDDGTLTTPEGSWSEIEIADIDMSRWIAKTGNARSTWTAKVITSDGNKILLDDYVYQDMHLIIGKIAHRFYPDRWTPLAKRVVVEKPKEDNQEE